jgi:nucleotide-binding universal stress UspA family protein
MFRKILLPTDFLPHAEHALKIAADLARTYDAELMLLHVHEVGAFELPNGYVTNMPSELDRMYEQLNQRLAELEQRAREIGARRVHTRVVQGPILKEIASFASDYDLIVMGSHGRKGIEHLLLGSVAESVLQRAPCPVLIVRTAAVNQAAA